MDKARSAVRWLSYAIVTLLVIFVVLCALKLSLEGQGASITVPQLHPFIQSAVFFLAAAGICALFIRFSGNAARLPVRISLLAMVAFRLLSGAALAISTHISPRYDFLTYYRMAGELLHGRAYLPDYVSVFPHVMGYPTVLSAFFSVFGQRVIVAQCVNIALSCLTVLLVYEVGRLTADRKAGLIAALLWTAAPSQIFYPLLVCTEPLFMFLTLLCATLALRAVRQKSGLRGALMMCLLGALCAVTSKIRPNGIIVLIALIIMLVLFWRPAFTLKIKKIDLTRPLSAACILIVFFASSSFASNRITSFIDRAPGKPGYGWNLFVGLNMESKGAWNMEDSALFTRLLNEKGASGAQQELFSSAMSRAGHLGVNTDTLRFFYHKINLMWGGDNEVIGYLAPAQQEGGRQLFLFSSYQKVWETVFDLYYFFLLMLCAWSLCVKLRGSQNTCVILCCLILAGTIALHLFVEAAPRYHYIAIPFFCLICGVAAMEGTSRGGRGIRLINKGNAA